MKAKQLAYLYNLRIDKIFTLNAIQRNFISEFRRTCEKRKAYEYAEIAQIYIELEIKWMAFSIRTGVAEKIFHEFMAKAYPIDTKKLFKILGRASKAVN